MIIVLLYDVWLLLHIDQQVLYPHVVTLPRKYTYHTRSSRRLTGPRDSHMAHTWRNIVALGKLKSGEWHPKHTAAVLTVEYRSWPSVTLARCDLLAGYLARYETTPAAPPQYWNSRDGISPPPCLLPKTARHSTCISHLHVYNPGLEGVLPSLPLLPFPYSVVLFSWFSLLQPSAARATTQAK